MFALRRSDFAKDMCVFTGKENDVERRQEPEEPPGRVVLCCKSSKCTIQIAQCMDSRSNLHTTKTASPLPPVNRQKTTKNTENSACK